MPTAVYDLEGLERLTSKFKIDDSGCWLWHGSLNQLGYAKCRWEGVTSYAHRVLYEFLVAPIPAGLDLDHLCRVPSCVNPDHMEPVTHWENVRRGNALPNWIR